MEALSIVKGFTWGGILRLRLRMTTKKLRMKIEKEARSGRGWF